MTSYAQKSSAQRAAKKLAPNSFNIVQNDDQTWSITTKGPALQAFLADHEAEKAAKKAKAIEIKARHQAEKEISIPAQAPAPEIKGEEVISTANQGDLIANAALVNINPAKPKMSTALKPTKLVWAIADSMPGATRKEVTEECVKQGIAYGTARTQYQHWFKCVNDCKATPIATIGKDGKIVPPVKK